MENRYMGPDGEPFASNGPGRTSTNTLNSLSQEFAHFRDGWYKAKLNEMCTYGALSQSMDDIELMRLYNLRRQKTTEKKKPIVDRKRFRQPDF